MPEQQPQFPNLPMVGAGMTRLLCKLFGEEVGVPKEDYINLTDKETLYALRCVAQVEPATASRIGIAERALSSLATDGLLTYSRKPKTYEVNERGRKVLDLAGGFKYG